MTFLLISGKGRERGSEEKGIRGGEGEGREVGQRGEEEGSEGRGGEEQRGEGEGQSM